MVQYHKKYSLFDTSSRYSLAYSIISLLRWIGIDSRESTTWPMITIEGFWLLVTRHTRPNNETPR